MRDHRVAAMVGMEVRQADTADVVRLELQLGERRGQHAWDVECSPAIMLAGVGEDAQVGDVDPAAVERIDAPLGA